MSNRRKITVTGAASGIGRATADGCDVCVNARREERLRELVITFPPGNHLVCAGSYDDAAVGAAMEKKLPVLPLSRARVRAARHPGQCDRIGIVDTEMSVGTDGVNELATEWFRANYVTGNDLPLKRRGRSEEIAGVAAFLS